GRISSGTKIGPIGGRSVAAASAAFAACAAMFVWTFDGSGTSRPSASTIDLKAPQAIGPMKTKGNAKIAKPEERKLQANPQRKYTATAHMSQTVSPIDKYLTLCSPTNHGCS